MSQFEPPQSLTLRACERGFLISKAVGAEPPADLFAFDHIADMARWLDTQFAIPLAAPDPARGPSAFRAADQDTDLRQGVTFVQHAVLDTIEQHGEDWSILLLHELVALARTEIGGIAQTNSAGANVQIAIRAAALLISAAERMSDSRTLQNGGES